MTMHQASHVLSVLANAGADTSARRAFDFYLYFPTEHAAAAASRELSDSGFRCIVRESLRGQWLCLAGARLVPDDAAMETVFHLMETMAEDFGGAFDGWETQVKMH
jgi:hypothetical protein